MGNTKESDEKTHAVGPAIRRIRMRKGIRLVQISEKTGINPGNLSKIETSKQGYTERTLVKIAAAMGVEPIDIHTEALHPNATGSDHPPMFSRADRPHLIHSQEPPEPTPSVDDLTKKRVLDYLPKPLHQYVDKAVKLRGKAYFADYMSDRVLAEIKHGHKDAQAALWQLSTLAKLAPMEGRQVALVVIYDPDMQLREASRLIVEANIHDMQVYLAPSAERAAEVIASLENNESVDNLLMSDSSSP